MMQRLTVNYWLWLKAQLPHHGRRFVDDFRKQQMRLVASYYGVYEMNELEDRWSDVRKTINSVRNE